MTAQPQPAEVRRAAEIMLVLAAIEVEMPQRAAEIRKEYA